MPNQPDGSVREQLLATVDELTASMTGELEEVRAVTEQLAPGAGPVVPERDHDGVGDGRRDPAAGPRPPARRARTVT